MDESAETKLGQVMDDLLNFVDNVRALLEED